MISPWQFILLHQYGACQAAGRLAPKSTREVFSVQWLYDFDRDITS